MPAHSASLSPSVPIPPSPAHSHHSATGAVSESNVDMEARPEPSNMVDETESPLPMQRKEEWAFLPFPPIVATFAEAGALPPELRDDFVRPGMMSTGKKEYRINSEMLRNKYVSLGIRENIGGRTKRLVFKEGGSTDRTGGDDEVEGKANSGVGRPGLYQSRLRRATGLRMMNGKERIEPYNHERFENRLMGLHRYAPYHTRKNNGDGKMRK